MEIQNFPKNDREKKWVNFFHFDKNEMIHLKKVGKREIKIIDKKIEKIKNHVKNEGQVTFQMKIEDLENLKYMWIELIE